LHRAVYTNRSSSLFWETGMGKMVWEKWYGKNGMGKTMLEKLF
jgi:hypothetical protein